LQQLIHWSGGAMPLQRKGSRKAGWQEDMDRAQDNGVEGIGDHRSFRLSRCGRPPRAACFWLGFLAVVCVPLTVAAGQGRSLPDTPSALPASRPAEYRSVESQSITSEFAEFQPSQSANTPDGTSLSPQKAQAAAAATPAANQTAATANPANQAISDALPPCPRQGLRGTLLFLPGRVHDPCEDRNQLQFIVDTGPIRPLTVRQKGMLAERGITDPSNLITIAGFSAITIGTNSHTAYGPGFEGFATLFGYSLVGDIQGEVVGTFAIPVLTHEDPRYHRLPGRPFARRLEHAIVHTYVTQHDNGSLMPNYSVLLGYPIGNEVANLYVPGLQTNGSATAERIAVGIATDPVGALIAEFLPDVAKHIHIHVIFMQQILNQVATGSSAAPGQ
jgi:hypothetical protein